MYKIIQQKTQNWICWNELIFNIKFADKFLYSIQLNIIQIRSRKELPLPYVLCAASIEYVSNTLYPIEAKNSGNKKAGFAKYHSTYSQKSVQV